LNIQITDDAYNFYIDNPVITFWKFYLGGDEKQKSRFDSGIFLPVYVEAIGNRKNDYFKTNIMPRLNKIISS